MKREGKGTKRGREGVCVCVRERERGREREREAGREDNLAI